MALPKIVIKLHQMGFDTRSYKWYVFDLQDDINADWLAKMQKEPDYRQWRFKCKTRYYDFTGEYDMVIRQYHYTPEEAYNWVFEEFISK